MEDNNIMVTENEDVLEPVETEEATESNFGAGVLVGGLAAVAIIAIAKKVKEVWKARKDKEPMVNRTDPNLIDITPDVVDTDDETE